MSSKLFLLLLLSSSFLFPAKIGFINANGANCIRPIEIERLFKKNGHTIEPTSFTYANKFDVILSQNKLAPNEKIAKKTILICMEPKILINELYDRKITEKYARVYTFNHDLCPSKKYEKMFYPCLVHLNSDTLKKALENVDFYNKQPCKDILKLSAEFIPFSKRKLACLINSILAIDSPEENYSKRVEVAKFYNSHFPEELSLYGMGGWDKYNLSIYKGFCKWDDRSKLFNEHKFCFCYENWENDVHYISEKIHICFEQLCVPIYKGSTRITEYIPKECFINANDFHSVAEIHAFISNMDEERWMGYINAIAEFVLSDASKVFTNESHAERLLKSANEVFGEISCK